VIWRAARDGVDSMQIVEQADSWGRKAFCKFGIQVSALGNDASIRVCRRCPRTSQLDSLDFIDSLLGFIAQLLSITECVKIVPAA